MATIFVSYSRSDADFVRRLVDHLKTRSIDYWLDVDHIQAGADWSDAVWGALQRCDLMLLVVSPASMASKEVSNEWKYYQNLGKPIIPALVNAATNIHYQLVAMHYIDFDRYSFEEATEQLEGEITRVTQMIDAAADDREATVPDRPQPADDALPVTNQLDPSRVESVLWDRTTARINRYMFEQLEERLHYFNEEMVLEFIAYEQRENRVETKIKRGREYIVGRAGKGTTPDVDLTPLGAANLGISRKHVALKLEGDTLFIKDLHSTNNTYVEGKRLRGDEQLALKSGDRIQMGNLLLTVQFRPDAPAE
ncbi:MAG: TIR domain-containing protein [Anaerolineae bacterium]|nr:TIR domain-containing protein [Anaerolineae bacterium]